MLASIVPATNRNAVRARRLARRNANRRNEQRLGNWTSAVSQSSLPEVRDNPAQRRFELIVDGGTAAAYYDLSPGVITFTHTEVPRAIEGRGIGSQLARGALEAVRAQGLKVVAECPFIQGYIGKHAEFQDLLR